MNLSDEKALEYLDKLFPLFPDTHFIVDEIIFKSDFKDEAYDYGNKITFLLLDQFKYADSWQGRYSIFLNEKGMAAKKAGGHFNYENHLKNETINAKRTNEDSGKLIRKQLTDIHENKWYRRKTFIWTVLGILLATILSLILLLKNK